MLWWDVWEAATLSSEDTMSVLRQVRELEVTRGSAAENAS